MRMDWSLAKKQSWLGSRTVDNTIYRLKKKDKIKSSGRGMYVKA